MPGAHAAWRCRCGTRSPRSTAAALRDEARAHFGLARPRPRPAGLRRLAGRRRLNPSVAGALPGLRGRGHPGAARVGTATSRPRRRRGYVAVPYVDRMDLAYAAADLALRRAGAMTVAELAAVGLPGGVRAAADRQRRAGAQRPPGRRGRRRPAGRRRGSSLRSGSPRRLPVLHDGERLRAMGAAARRMGCATPTSSWPASCMRVGSVRSGRDEPRRPSLGRVHFVGIGGAGHVRHRPHHARPRRHGVAAATPRTRAGSQALRALGVDATSATTPRLVAGRRHARRLHRDPRGQPRARSRRGTAGSACCSRAEALASVMAGRRGVAVAGTHGKTTTTSMLTVALQHCGADPSFAIGGELNESGSNAHHGTGDVFVAEADESDGSFLSSRPIAAIVTNVEADHLDNCGTDEATEQAFLDVRRPASATATASWSCAPTTPAARGSPAGARGGRRRAHVRRGAEADYRLSDARLTDDGWAFDTVHNGVRLGELALQVPGRHNALNAAGRLRHRPGPGLPGLRPARRAGGVHRHPAAVRVQGPGRRGPRLRRLRPPPDRDRGDLRGRPRRRRGRPGGRRLPAAPLLPHRDLRRGDRRGARAGRRGGRARRLRAGRDPDPGCQRPDGGRRRAAAAGAGGLRAVVVGGRRHLVDRAAARRPRADPGCRRHRHDRPRGARPAAGARGRSDERAHDRSSVAVRAPPPSTSSVRPSARRRWLAAGCWCCSAALAGRGRRGLGGAGSPRSWPCTQRAGRRGRGGPGRAPCSRPRRGPDRACRWRASTPPPPSARCRRCRGSRRRGAPRAGRTRSSSR